MPQLGCVGDNPVHTPTKINKTVTRRSVDITSDITPDVTSDVTSDITSDTSSDMTLDKTSDITSNRRNPELKKFLYKYARRDHFHRALYLILVALPVVSVEAAVFAVEAVVIGAH